MSDNTTYQTTALRALKYLAAGYGRNDNTPLRTQINSAINPEGLVDPQELAHTIDYAMRYLAQVTWQVPAAFVPSMTSIEDLTKISHTYTIFPICRQAIEFMASEMSPGALDCQLAAQAIRGIAQTIAKMVEANIVDKLHATTFGALVREELQRSAYLDADHPNCVRTAIYGGLTYAADRRIGPEDYPLDIGPVTNLVNLLNRAAETVDSIW